MANCPNCGSNHIQIKQETDVNWGRAIAGYALFGVVGGAVGAVTGEDRNVNACLDCGTSWKAQDLYKLLQVIEDYTGEKLNLARERDRSYMNKFISKIIPYLENISETDKKAEELITNAKKEAENKATPGCSGIGCLFFIFGIPVIGSFPASASFIIFLMVLSPVILGCIIDITSLNGNKKAIEEAVENAKRKAIRMKLEAEENFKIEIKNFMNNNHL
ncbi:hypothetical protein [Fortiea contorta]|uniref:hypothetical protein n=1 Tax=Fortiea contorta TaxID=1892405 RepID=UPI00034C94FF|nr:hypothetical protein [Fortiea contorta]